MKGKAIIKAILREHHVSADDFFGSGHARFVVYARVDAIQRMNDLGMNGHAIARIMKRNHSTIFYWLRPEYRARRKKYYQDHWIQNRPPARRRQAKVTPEQRAELLALFAAGNLDEVGRIQTALDVKPSYTRDLAAQMRRREAGTDSRLSLPVLAPIRQTRGGRPTATNLGAAV
jgi:hypothetical protein